MFDNIDQYDKKKLILLSITAFLIAAGYAALRPIRISAFFHIVGRQYYPLTKFLMIIFAIPSVALYSKLVDKYKKDKILCITFSFYAIICLIFAYLLAHPAYGLPNTNTNPYRLVGWTFTLLMDFYSTFAIGTLWAFINSVSTPEFAKKGYSTIYLFIKIAGILATIGSFFITNNNLFNNPIPILVFITSLLLIAAIIIIILTVKQIPQEHLCGYSEKNVKSKKTKLGMIEGLKLMLLKPYVFGLFLIFYFYDVIFTIVEYQAMTLLSIQIPNCTKMSSILFLSAFISQIIGLFAVIFITPILLKKIPLKISLLTTPILTIAIIFSIAIFPNLITMVAAISLLPAINFSINSPIREILFIPTSKNIQFKSKAWIDSFGRTLSKSSASTINMLFNSSSMGIFIAFNSVFSLALTLIWGTVSYFMGKECQETIDQKELIGE